MENEFEFQEGAAWEANPPAGDILEETLVIEEPVAPQQSYAQYDPNYGASNQPRFEPSGQYRWSRPDLVQEQPVDPQKPKKVKKAKKPKKGGGVFKKILSFFLILILALSCSLVGGIAGVKYMEYKAEGNTASDSDKDSSKKPSNKDDGGSNVLEGDRGNSIIDVDKIDTSKIMTPAEVYKLNVNSTVGITTSITTNYWGYTTTSAASGSGFIYSDDGYIITNYHVVENSNSISVSFYDGTSVDAKLIGFDESNDVAVLKVEVKEKLTPVILGDSDNMNVGDSVLAIGNPLGELTFSLTSGTISALDREVTFSGGITMNLIQTDCAINSGNSGGALFNLYGEVVGVTNAKYSGNSASGASIDNIGFAIPMNHVRTIVDSIIENGYVVKPYIGVTINDVSEETQAYGLPSGAAIQSIVEDSPAEKAGLQKNDIVTHINGEKIDGASDLKSIVSKSNPGDTLKLTVWRKGETIELTLTVGKQTQETSVQQEQIPQTPSYPNYGYGWNN